MSAQCEGIRQVRAVADYLNGISVVPIAKTLVFLEVQYIPG